ncbi:unnamed protein product [Phytophthora lilii]|uniref:Unnamed protein product n=1 Tax=Phytophthora lilii TaxID=2077276 RepID=A0A9W6XFQ5_9STRA|nr:unnamed protein product [Phytophthora lilii]
MNTGRRSPNSLLDVASGSSDKQISIYNTAAQNFSLSGSTGIVNGSRTAICPRNVSLGGLTRWSLRRQRSGGVHVYVDGMGAVGKEGEQPYVSSKVDPGLELEFVKRYDYDQHRMFLSVVVRKVAVAAGSHPVSQRAEGRHGRRHREAQARRHPHGDDHGRQRHVRLLYCSPERHGGVELAGHPG